jgi:hypothetical protein
MPEARQTAGGDEAVSEKRFRIELTEREVELLWHCMYASDPQRVSKTLKADMREFAALIDSVGEKLSVFGGDRPAGKPAPVEEV